MAERLQGRLDAPIPVWPLNYSWRHFCCPGSPLGRPTRARGAFANRVYPSPEDTVPHIPHAPLPCMQLNSLYIPAAPLRRAGIHARPGCCTWRGHTTQIIEAQRQCRREHAPASRIEHPSCLFPNLNHPSSPLCRQCALTACNVWVRMKEGVWQVGNRVYTRGGEDVRNSCARLHDEVMGSLCAVSSTSHSLHRARGRGEGGGGGGDRTLPGDANRPQW